MNNYHLAGGIYGREWSCGPISDDYSGIDHVVDWERTWKVSQASINNHINMWNTANYVVPPSIADWPEVAEYVDFNSNSVYDPENGDYPVIRGDEAVLSITNDDIVRMPGRNKMRVEIHTLNYAYNSTGSALNNTIFTNYKIFNKSDVDYHSVYLSLFEDYSLGGYTDDYIGSDTSLNALYFYNADNDDAILGIGNIPAKGLSFLNTNMSSATYFTNTCSYSIGAPEEPLDYYCYLMGHWRDGTVMTYGECFWR